MIEVGGGGGCQDFDISSEELVLALFSGGKILGCAPSLTATIKHTREQANTLAQFYFGPVRSDMLDFVSRYLPERYWLQITIRYSISKCTLRRDPDENH